MNGEADIFVLAGSCNSITVTPADETSPDSCASACDSAYGPYLAGVHIGADFQGYGCACYLCAAGGLVDMTSGAGYSCTYSGALPLPGGL